MIVGGLRMYKKKIYMMCDIDDKVNMGLKKRLLKDLNGSWFIKCFGI